MLRAVAASVVVSLAVVVPNAGAATINQTINGWIAHSKFAGAHTTLLVFDRTTGRFVANHRASTVLKPASNMKLVTSATALLRYGTATRLSTQVMTGGSTLGRDASRKPVARRWGRPVALDRDVLA